MFFILFLVTTTSALTALQFQAAVSYTVGSEPNWVSIGDINADGIPDLVTANYKSDSISVLLGNGEGTFQTQITHSTGSEPMALAVALLHVVNATGVSVVAANVGARTASVFVNRDGLLLPQTSYSEPWSDLAHGIALADTNNDLKLDLIVAAGNDLVVLLGYGNGTFNDTPVGSNFPSYTYSPWPVTTLAVADLNQDNLIDVVVAVEYPYTELQILLGQGNGKFVASSKTYGALCPLYSIALGDLNNDSLLDIAAACDYNGELSSVYVFINVGDATFVEASPPTVPVGNTPHSVVLADMNNDGWLDIVVANYDANNVMVFLGNGNGAFQTPPTSTLPVGDEPQYAAVADLNNDTWPDIAACSNGGASVSVFLAIPPSPPNTTAPTTAPATTLSTTTIPPPPPSTSPHTTASPTTPLHTTASPTPTPTPTKSGAPSLVSCTFVLAGAVIAVMV